MCLFIWHSTINFIRAIPTDSSQTPSRTWDIVLRRAKVPLLGSLQSQPCKARDNGLKGMRAEPRFCCWLKRPSRAFFLRHSARSVRRGENLSCVALSESPPCRGERSDSRRCYFFTGSPAAVYRNSTSTGSHLINALPMLNRFAALENTGLWGFFGDTCSEADGPCWKSCCSGLPRVTRSLLLPPPGTRQTDSSSTGCPKPARDEG